MVRAGQKKKQTPEQIAAVLARLRPQLTYDGFDKVDIVVEAALEVHRPPLSSLNAGVG